MSGAGEPAMDGASSRFQWNPGSPPAFEEDNMRKLFALVVLLLCCGFMSAQDAWTYPGQYAAPFDPRLSTPIASPGALPTPFLTLNTPPLTVGASNSTLENAAGSPVYFNQPLVYQPGVQYKSPVQVSSGSSAQTFPAISGGRNGIDLGAATFQMDYGVAQLAGIAPRKRAKKTYTNPDVAGINEATNTIKFRGKVERVN